MYLRTILQKGANAIADSPRALKSFLALEALVLSASREVRYWAERRRQSHDLKKGLRADLRAKHPTVSDERIDDAVKIAAKEFRVTIESEDDGFGADDLKTALKAAQEIHEVLTSHHYVYS